jgi:hypothetical protein
MDVPLALNDIGIRYGLKGYKRKSSTFCYQADVEGFSMFFARLKGQILLMSH